MKLNINEEIKKALIKNKISVTEGISALIILYYDLEPSFIPDDLYKKLYASEILTKDYSKDIFIWKIPLFEEQVNNYDWIKEWMNLFSEVNKERRGVRATVFKRMQDFFKTYPEYTPEDVLEGTKLYFRHLQDPQYCKKSHKFIKEQDGTSLLKEWVETYKESQERTLNNVI